MTVLDSIPFEFDFDTFSTQIHLSRYPEAADRVQKMLELALPLIRPKALYRMTYIEERGKDTIGTGGDYLYQPHPERQSGVGRAFFPLRRYLRQRTGESDTSH